MNILSCPYIATTKKLLKPKIALDGIYLLNGITPVSLCIIVSNTKLNEVIVYAHIDLLFYGSSDLLNFKEIDYVHQELSQWYTK